LCIANQSKKNGEIVLVFQEKEKKKKWERKKKHQRTLSLN
jgi:16S rRNA C1402 (ribose-2'-O) methylase RsmI